METVEIAVIGGGPAGATFARLAGHDAHVALLERQPADAAVTSGKCCSGLLSPDAQCSLARLGLTLPLEVLVDPQIFAVRTMDLAMEQERYYSRSYVNMDRRKFDRWLLSLLPDNVILKQGAHCQRIERDRNGFCITYRQERETHTLHTKTVVGADGGYSLVRRTFFPDVPMRRYAALQEWVPSAGQSPFYGALFDRKLTDCYGWLISKDHHLIVGGAFPLDHANERFVQMKDKLVARGLSLSFPQRREGCVVCRPTGPSQFCTGESDVFLLGEAAGFISPSSLQGISYALDSGRLLAQALATGMQGAQARYHRLTLSLRMQLLGKLAKNPVLYTPAVRRWILTSGVGSVPMPIKNPAKA